jgi:cytidylate kinase
LIIAIDGPAGAGKSTTARRVAESLGFRYLDTGLMYRAIALGALRAGLSATSSDDEIEEALPSIELELVYRGHEQRALLSGVDCTAEVRSRKVSSFSSRVARVEAVRMRLVAVQRRVAAEYGDPGIVVEGRDIGTVVFPEADLKIFLDADVDERARRRYEELSAKGEDVSMEGLIAEVRSRDQNDRSRRIAPLRAAEDAICIDTTDLSFEQQVDRVVELARTRSLHQPPGTEADNLSPSKPQQSVVATD